MSTSDEMTDAEATTSDGELKAPTMEEQMLDEHGNALDGFYSEEHQEIVRWLATQRRPPHMTRDELTSMKRKALQFVVQHQKLFHKVRKSTILLQLVVDDPEERIRVCDDEFSYKGRGCTRIFEIESRGVTCVNRRALPGEPLGDA
jgi:hypothetical protein